MGASKAQGGANGGAVRLKSAGVSLAGDIPATALLSADTDDRALRLKCGNIRG
jgi:hypothetical protein